MKIKVYTDGACSGNPGSGGWGVVMCMPHKTEKYSGFEKETTNNRMELTAVIVAIEKMLEKIYQEAVTHEVPSLEIVSDSAYVVNAVTLKWLYFWKGNNYINSKGEEVKNRDLWERLDLLLQEAEFISCNVIFTKVKGHSGDTFNEMADRLATGAIKSMGER